ncbi:uncharacterized protein LOC112692050 isoform X2 [Sipha flava]|nr:uncharacterized protein LOC112692050 isoform X2 [Sipha flava]
MALVNTKWYYASIHPEFARNEVFGYNENAEKLDLTLGDDGLPSDLPIFNEFKSMLLNSKRKFFNLTFDGSLYVYRVFPIFKNLADYIVSVHINNLARHTDMLLDAILDCDKLEQLEFKGVGDLTYGNTTRQQILSLKRIYFEGANLTDFCFNNIMRCAPNLEELGFENCNILIWHQAIRRFYPNYKDSKKKQTFNSLDIFSYVNIVNYLETAKNIKTLRLGNNYHIFLNLPIHIKLVSLELNFKNLCFTRDYAKVGDKLSTMSTLEYLDLIHFPCCVLASCVPKLCNLKRLNAHYFLCGYQDECFSKVLNSLKNKKNLKELMMVSLEDSVPLEIPDCTLEKLTTYIGLTNVFKITRMSQNLTRLKILNGDILTACDYKLIFKNLIGLQKLIIDHCFQLDDNVFSDLPINNLKALNTLHLFHTKLTYQCFKYINNKELRKVWITDVSIEKCIELNDMSDFKNVLKAFSGFVPELTTLNIDILKENRSCQDIEVFSEIPMLISTVYNNFKKMKICSIN